MNQNFVFVENYADDKIYNHVKNLQISEDDTDVPHLLKKPRIKVFGKECRQNRNVGFFSNVSEGYRYSNQTMRSQKLTKELAILLKKVNEDFQTDFNGILINHYEDGTHYIGKHRDDETGLDPQKSAVASISFGATRKFRIRDNDSKIVRDIPTYHGSFMMMQYNFQKLYTHEIPIEKKVKTERFSLTFRHHKK